MSHSRTPRKERPNIRPLLYNLKPECSYRIEGYTGAVLLEFFEKPKICLDRRKVITRIRFFVPEKAKVMRVTPIFIPGFEALDFVVIEERIVKERPPKL